MGIYNSPHSGTKVFRNRKRIKNERTIFNLTYGEVFPVFSRFVLPGDIWKLRPNCFIRYMPQLAPCLTEVNADFRFFFVPLRQIVENIEQIITGSNNGSLITSALPECTNFVKEFLTRVGSGSLCSVHKNSFWAALGVRPTEKLVVIDDSPTPLYRNIIYQNYNAESEASDFPASYWYKAYCKIIFEFYRDENYQSFDGDFEKFYDYMLGKSSAESDASTYGWYFSKNEYEKLQSTASDFDVNSYGANNFKLWFANLNKDYFMSALPWIMKGSEPTINSVMHADFSSSVNIFSNDSSNAVGVYGAVPNAMLNSGELSGGVIVGVEDTNTKLLNALNKNTISDGGFSAQDIRDLFAETRVFERLARCGSRYVEYLEANFGIAPRDDTLQRPLYLGGYQQPIVTTEVVQTGGSDTGDVGTLRGHGISSGGNSIRPFVATEFGVIFGLMCVKPKTQYLYQLKREFSYKKRFDFFNPSFQTLSEQQVNSVEFACPSPVWDPNDSPDTTETHDGNTFKVWTTLHDIPRFTLGYQGMYNELRYGNDMIVRDLANNLAYWTQSIRPFGIDPTNYTEFTLPLNGVNISIGKYLFQLLKPFEAQNGDFKPMIVDFGMGGSVFRPMIKDPIPSLVDHH